MRQWQSLADALLDEDRILRRRLATLSAESRSRRGPDGTLSFQETLGHLAYWDAFTVDFFTAKLDRAGPQPQPPADFARQSEAAIAKASELPFTDVLARYLVATGALVGFISRYWDELSEKEQKDFWVPLKHRRHHREALFKSLDAMGSGHDDGDLATRA